MSKEAKLEKKEAQAAKKAAKAEKAAASAAAKAEKKHAKEYDKFVKEANKKNEKGAKKGAGFTPIVIPSIGDFQSKSEIKAAKANEKAYAAYVAKIEKKNASLEKKCAKKGKPFVPIAIPDKEEVILEENKKKKIFCMILMLLLIWFMIYFIIMWCTYIAPFSPVAGEETTDKVAVYDYDAYSNPHEITTTPDYSIADAKLFLKQVIHDNYSTIGFSSDVSNSSITYNNRTVQVNNAECYVFTCSGKTFAVPIKLSACYVYSDGKYVPLTFNDTEIIFK